MNNDDENGQLSSKITQEEISNGMQQQIEKEMKLLPDVCTLLTSVLTAKNFMMEIGGGEEDSLPKFLVRLRFLLKFFLGSIVRNSNNSVYRENSISTMVML